MSESLAIRAIIFLIFYYGLISHIIGPATIELFHSEIPPVIQAPIVKATKSTAAFAKKSILSLFRVVQFAGILFGMIFLFQAHAQACDPPRTGPNSGSGGPFPLGGSAGMAIIVKFVGGNPNFNAGGNMTTTMSSGASYDAAYGGCDPVKTSFVGFYIQKNSNDTRSYSYTNGYGGGIAMNFTTLWASPKNFGCTDSILSGNAPTSACTMVANPISVSTGNKYQVETDFVGASNTQLELRRHYNSLTPIPTAFGLKWSSTYDRRVVTHGNIYTEVYRPEGRVDTFWLTSGSWVSDADVRITLAAVMSGGTQTGWQIVAADDTIENYNISGQLTSIVTRAGLTTTLAYNPSNQLATVTGPFGHVLTYTYNGDGNVYQITAPNSEVYTYAYDANNNLISVTYPDSTVRQYAYTNTSYPNALTGITDENNNVYATYGYDSNGRVNSSQHAGGAELTTVSYSSNIFGIYAATVTDARSNTHSYTFTRQFGTVKPTALTGAPVQSVGGKSFAYDSNGFISRKTDYNNNVTKYTHDSKGNETSRIEAYGTTLARTISTTWGSTFHLPTQITEPNRTTTFTYDASGNMLTKTITASGQTRTWTYTYNGNGQVLTAQDANSNTTTYTYNSTGDVATITNALSQVTNFTSYDSNGRLLSKTDPNGLVTAFTYDARGRLSTKTVGGETTSYTYDNAGNMTRVTRPDSSYFNYTYDAAHRLTGISDILGNSIVYTLDATSNVTAKNIYDVNNNLVWTKTYTYNSVNRRLTEVGSSSQTTTYGYDSNGNLTSLSDPLGHAFAYAYDALNRRKQETNPVSGITQYGYDANDHLASVTDPRNLVTTYTTNGLDNLTAISSPDTGATSKTYDTAGNVLTSTDARSKTATYTYDALNRVTNITYTGGATISKTYDQGTYGIGHLTTLTDPAGTTTWTYDIRGRVTQKQQTTGTVVLTTGYGYDSYDRISTVTYPSGKTITLAYDTAGRVSGITSGGATVIGSITYKPFIGVSGWTAGNGQTYARTIDQDGRTSGVTIAGTTTLTYTLDNANRITGLTETGLANKTFGYDNLDRLTSFVNGTDTTTYTYNADSNRTTRVVSGGTTTYNYPTTSNKLSSLTGYETAIYGYDASGNLTSDGTNAWTYDARGRMDTQTVSAITTSYGVNGLGQRITKSGAGVPPAGLNEYAYDEKGHILGEYDDAGTALNETVWLGNIPVAVLKGTGESAATYFINPDNLNAPHIITNAAGTAVWTWDHLDFGNNAPNQNPNGLGVFNYNLRFPGQYADAESGLYNNYFRDYSPNLGRYVQSDPIGLKGGIDTFGYVGGNPLRYTDPSGLQAAAACVLGPIPCAAGIGADIGKAITIGAGLWVLNQSAHEQQPSNTSGNKDPCPSGYNSKGTRKGDLPAKGSPNSSGVKDNGDGTGQIRDYGPNGKAEKDFDFGHDHTGAGDPHAHDWDWNKIPPRQPPRPLLPNE